jgi:hypothetical protein
VGTGQFTLMLQAKTVPEERLAVSRMLRMAALESRAPLASRERAGGRRRVRRPSADRGGRRAEPGLYFGRVRVSLRVYDARRRAKIPFEPVVPGRVGMYVCGMTVQDRPHVGHMRYAVAGDVIRRILESRGYQVNYATNVTDIGDRIIGRGNKEGVPFEQVSERNIQASSPTRRSSTSSPRPSHPRATEHIPEILALIQRLIDSGHAYAAGGDVYFDVRSYPAYGSLSGRKVDDLRAGVRIEVGEAKRDPLGLHALERAKPGEPSRPVPGDRDVRAGTSSARPWR